jgi:hypothetical protein
MIKIHAFVYSLLLPIILLYPLLFILFILCILNKKKKNFNKYRYVYKECNFVIYASLPALMPPGFAGRFGDKAPAKVR